MTHDDIVRSMRYTTKCFAQSLLGLAHAIVEFDRLKAIDLNYFPEYMRPCVDALVAVHTESYKHLNDQDHYDDEDYEEEDYYEEI